MEKTISVYDGLATVRECFVALGDTGRVIRDDLVPALRGWVETMRVCAETDRRIQAIAAASKNGHSVRDQIIIDRLDRARRELEIGGAA